MHQTALQASEAASVLQSSLSLTASGAFSEGALSRQSSQAFPSLQPSQESQQHSQASVVVLVCVCRCPHLLQESMVMSRPSAGLQ